MESYPSHPDRNLTSDSEIKINIQHVPTKGSDTALTMKNGWASLGSGIEVSMAFITLSWGPRILMRLAHQWLHVLQNSGSTLDDWSGMVWVGTGNFWKIRKWVAEFSKNIRKSEAIEDRNSWLKSEPCSLQRFKKGKQSQESAFQRIWTKLVSLYKMLGECPWTHQSPWNAALFRPLRHCHCTERDATVAWAAGEGKALKHGVTGVMMKFRINVNDCQRRRMAVQYWMCHPHRWEQSFLESNIVLQFLQYIRIRLMKEWWKKGLTRYRFS